MERLLQYLSTHKDYGIRYYASNMQLQGQSDASYLSRPRAKSACVVSSIVAVWAPGFLKLGGQYVAGVEAALMPLGRID